MSLPRVLFPLRRNSLRRFGVCPFYTSGKSRPRGKRSRAVDRRGQPAAVCGRYFYHEKGEL